MSQRLVVIDDTDPNIQYSGPWFKPQYEYEYPAIIGNFGSPFDNTLHGVNVNASFSFAFNGSQVTVMGTTITTNASGTQDPTWECFVDNISIGWNITAGLSQNNWPLCIKEQLQDGPHVLRLQATVLNQHIFWFDDIQYLPSSNVPLDQALLRINSGNLAIQYSSGWQPLHGIVNYTQTAGSTLTYDFSGISIAWFGFIPEKFPLHASSATYSIDVLFQTGNLSVGVHRLVVTHQGNTTTAPLALDYFVVQPPPAPSTSSTDTATGTSTGTSTASSGVSSSTSSNSTSSQTSKKSPIRAIVGGVFGGVIFLLLILFFIRRGRNRKAQRLSKFTLDSDVDDFHDTVEPFTLTPPHPTPAFRSPQIINSKSSQNILPTNAPIKMASTSSQAAFPTAVSDVGLPSPFPFHNHSSPAAASSSPSGGLHLASSQTGLTDGMMTRNAPEAEIVQRSESPGPGGANARFVRHEDSGIRMPPAEEEIVELPPLYTPG